MPSEQLPQDRDVAIAFTSIKLIFYFLFLVIYIVRINKLDQLASNNFL